MLRLLLHLPFFFNDTAPTEIYTLSLHDALPILNVGGPLLIPHVYDDREKTFFFINYNLARTRDPVDSFATVPTAPERGGDFSDRGVQLFDPRSRAPLGSKIPTDKLPLDPAALGLLRFIPLPNLPGLVQNFHLQTRVPTASDSFNVRVIHTI